MSITPPVVAIKQHTPAFKEEYQPGRDYDPIKERKEHREFIRKVRREKKGAMKELRKDTSFLIGEQRKVEAALRAEGERKRKIAMAQFEIERRDTNILQKQSKKNKK
jgi:nucleolar protein 14